MREVGSPPSLWETSSLQATKTRLLSDWWKRKCHKTGGSIVDCVPSERKALKCSSNATCGKPCQKWSPTGEHLFDVSRDVFDVVVTFEERVMEVVIEGEQSMLPFLDMLHRYFLNFVHMEKGIGSNHPLRSSQKVEVFLSHAIS